MSVNRENMEPFLRQCALGKARSETGAASSNRPPADV